MPIRNKKIRNAYYRKRYVYYGEKIRAQRKARYVPHPHKKKSEKEKRIVALAKYKRARLRLKNDPLCLARRRATWSRHEKKRLKDPVYRALCKTRQQNRRAKEKEKQRPLRELKQLSADFHSAMKAHHTEKLSIALFGKEAHVSYLRREWKRENIARSSYLRREWKRENIARSRKNRQRWTKTSKGRAYRKANRTKARIELRNSYIKRLLTKHTILGASDIAPLIVAKRKQIELQRLTKEN
jgi:hypothetical protein